MFRSFCSRAAALCAVALMALVARPAQAETRIYDIPVIRGFTSILFHTITPPGSRILSTTFTATYENNGTGLDAADVSFVLVNFETGTYWTLTGDELGWSGTGTFQASRSTTRFNGFLSDTVLWETLTLSAPGNLSGHFRLVVDLPDPITPPCQQIPNPCLP